MSRVVVGREWKRTLTAIWDLHDRRGRRGTIARKVACRISTCLATNGACSCPGEGGRAVPWSRERNLKTQVVRGDRVLHSEQTRAAAMWGR
jgi:hypothetical protein